MTPEEYIEYCTKELNSILSKTKSGTPDLVQKYRAEGLFQAAKLLGILTNAEVHDIFEEEHFRVFGESIIERQHRKDELNKIKETAPDVYFDIPAIERKR